ncbi:MAG TPA: hypothetical protein P5567_12160 [Kiritimatiellia bacterium]|nr:hypothetical protein [Kiritimatiellia bacterium]HRZ13195.1 hypothetical protein [Kiritimatiellia bacterium]HSA19762.1 hypothetical protein [Kiritimatiellia bacterium]
MTEQQFRDQAAAIVKDRPAKVWLVRSAGHRLDFLWGVGVSRTAEPERLGRHGRHYLVGQDVPEELKPQLVALFDDFCQSDEVQQAESTVRPLRFVPAR